MGERSEKKKSEIFCGPTKNTSNFFLQAYPNNFESSM
jgi:hypothetical protein